MQLRIGKILSEFRGLKEIQGIKGASGSRRIRCINDRDGRCKEDSHSIADVFAEFYEDLYKCRVPNGGGYPEGKSHEDPAAEPFSLDELLGALKDMKRGKARDDAGVAAEMLKDSSDSFLESTLDLFNDVLSFRGDVPAIWRRTRITVIFKNGQLPSNRYPPSNV